MTKEEFIGPFNDLKAHFGPSAYSDQRAKLLWNLISELPIDWWRMIAHRMILSNDGRFDIYGAAKAELGHIRWQQRNDDEIGALHSFNRLRSEAGLDQALGKFGAKSLWEAIEKGKAQ